MRPIRGSYNIETPLTFDGTGGGRANKSSKLLWVFLVAFVWFFISLTVVILSDSVLFSIFFPLITLVISFYVVRYVVVHERFYRKKREELVEKQYMFDHSVFWNIYEVDKVFPYFCYFDGGYNVGCFVAFDKDVVVGKPDDSDYDHHESLSEAYKQMARRKIDCVHIDYMDTLGKDSRMSYLFSTASNTANRDLKDVLSTIYSNIEGNMERSYSSYDVYCFLYNGTPDMFWTELQPLLNYFKKANYIRYRILNPNGIADLVESLLNIEDFSVSAACDTVYRGLNQSSLLRPLWVMKDGEKQVINRPIEEMRELERIAKAERKAKRGKLRNAFRFNKKDDEVIDFGFDENTGMVGEEEEVLLLFDEEDDSLIDLPQGVETLQEAYNRNNKK